MNYSLLQLVIELTNVMQAISFSSNYIVYAMLNVQFRRAFQDVVCCRLGIADDMMPLRGQVQIEMDTLRDRRHTMFTTGKQQHIGLRATVHRTASASL